MTGHDTWRDQIAETIDEHRLTSPVQCTCGWRETVSDTDTWAEHVADAVIPIVDAAVAEARADTAEAIAKEIPNQSARVIREHEPRPHGCVCGAVFGDDIDRRWHLVNQALAAATDIARQHAGKVASDE